MTESGVPGIPIVVSGVQHGEPPFRIVLVNGEPVGQAFSIVDVIQFALHSGLEHLDLADTSVIRWVGGSQRGTAPLGLVVAGRPGIRWKVGVSARGRKTGMGVRGSLGSTWAGRRGCVGIWSSFMGPR
ncbi:hypothetical protein [Actinacidiphila oryziradicis]|uniref:hypothetical protein n=1 Tax=Actinacidiphila oryziradicis TaxID=2571141 RepID=UPI0026C0EBBB|nr:hypothetical protein [Actinacidiphila oryziradicis]